MPNCFKEEPNSKILYFNLTFLLNFAGPQKELTVTPKWVNLIFLNVFYACANVQEMCLGFLLLQIKRDYNKNIFPLTN